MCQACGQMLEQLNLLQLRPSTSNLPSVQTTTWAASRSAPGRSHGWVFELPLKDKFGAKLNDPGAARAGVRIQVRAPVHVFRDRERGGWIRIRPRSIYGRRVVLVVEVRMVERVESFKAELEISPLCVADRNVFEQGYVPILHATRAERVTRASHRRAYSGKNQVTTWGVRVEAVIERDCPILIRTSHASRRERKIAVKGYRRPGHELCHATYLPIVGNIRNPMWPTIMLGGVGEIVYIVGGEDVRPVPIQ